MTIETSDLYYAAFLVAKGHRIEGATWNTRGRCSWSFVLPVEDPQQPFMAFLRGDLVSGKAMAVAIVDLKKMAMNPAKPSTGH